MKDTSLLQENWILVGTFLKVKCKNFNFLQNFSVFSHIIQDTSWTTQPPPSTSDFLTANTTPYTLPFAANRTSLAFLHKNLETFENDFGFLEKNSDRVTFTPTMIRTGKPLYTHATWVALLVVWREFYWSKTPCIVFLN